jgi:shikimate kinase
MRHSKVSLIGFMGSGKSSVAPPLATRLGFAHVDLDTLVVHQSGGSSIPEIFRTVGEPAFRDLESSIAQSVAAMQGVVISTGGGIIGRPENMVSLKTNGGICVLLDASFEELMRRIPNASERPLLQDPDRAKELYSLRQPLYRTYADITIPTEGRTIEEICSEIVSRLG